MAELEEVTVTGRREPPRDFTPLYTGSLDPGYLGGDTGAIDVPVFFQDMTDYNASLGLDPEGHPLAEVTVTGTKAFVPPPLPPALLTPLVNVASTIGAGLAAAGAGLLGLLFPNPTAPREMDEAPDLETVTVTGSRPPKAPADASLPFDTPMPPNWNDLLRDYDFYWDTGGFPIPDFNDQLDRDRKRLVTVAPRAPGIYSDPRQLDEVTITPNRPEKRAPTSTPSPFFFGDAFELPFRFPIELPTPEFEPEAQPDRRLKPAPSTIGFPYANPHAYPFPGTFADPLLDPFADPTSSPEPDIRTDPFVPTSPQLPSPTASPNPLPPQFSGPTGFLDPVNEGPSLDTVPSDRIPQTPGGADVCDCATQKPKKKKPRKPRDVCYQGTYSETRSSTRKSRLKEIPCQ